MDRLRHDAVVGRVLELEENCLHSGMASQATGLDDDATHHFDK